MIYADFESILAPEDNGIKNSGELCTNKYCLQLLLTFIYLSIYLFNLSLKLTEKQDISYTIPT